MGIVAPALLGQFASWSATITSSLTAPGPVLHANQSARRAARAMKTATFASMRSARIAPASEKAMIVSPVFLVLKWSMGTAFALLTTSTSHLRTAARSFVMHLARSAKTLQTYYAQNAKTATTYKPTAKYA